MEKDSDLKEIKSLVRKRKGVSFYDPDALKRQDYDYNIEKHTLSTQVLHDYAKKASHLRAEFK